VIGVFSLTSCQPGSENGFWTNSSLHRCATKQFVVGETADQDSSGNTFALASTKSRFGSCTGNRSFGFEINYMTAQAFLMKHRVDGSGTFVCRSATSFSISSFSYGADASVVDRCGYGWYHAEGYHDVDDGYQTYVAYSSSPQGYNA
jgi:hypothetical protein